MKSSKQLVAELRQRHPNMTGAAIADELGISRQRVAQILDSLGLPTRVKKMSTGKPRPEYAAWRNMIRRCVDPSCDVFKYYGGRGIKVCKRWMLSFDHFYNDLGPRPSAAHSIDRINNHGDYEPRNCRWATRKEQFQNSSKRIAVPKDDDAALSKIQEIMDDHITFPTVADAIAAINKGKRGDARISLNTVYRWNRAGKFKPPLRPRPAGPRAYRKN